ncbi:MAG: YhfC family glutamic-type intramembrane protease [Candidatus Promineifilaceae bacterium]|nr:YhfC family glutamic-type intramembrane protease [Candidatus Promineifilaceae bacterium]
MYYFLYSLNVLLMLALPLALGTVIARRRSARWALFAIGAATFVGSQLFHLPFNWLVDSAGVLPDPEASRRNLLVVALFAGLSAGFFEEVARYLAYRFWARDARSWGAGLMLGAGHGGVEALLLGLVAAINVAFVFGFRHGYFTGIIPQEAVPLVQEQVTAFFSAPYYQTVLGAAERLFALWVHLSLSLLVMQVFARGRFFWLLLAIGWHALLDAVAVYGSVSWGIEVTEALVGLVALLSLGIIWRLYEPLPGREEPATRRNDWEPPRLGREDVELEITAERLEESRYR